MNQRTALLISAGITSFLLATGGGAAAFAARAATSPVAQTAVAVGSAATASSDTNVSSQMLQYQQALALANTRIQQANAEITQLQTQLQQAQAPVSALGQSYPVTVDQAKAIAQTALPGATILRTPDLVSYQGTAAYEVVTNSGTLFVNATTGQLINNSASNNLSSTVANSTSITSNGSTNGNE